MFQPVDPKKTLPQVEHDQLSHWKKHKIFEQSVDQRKGEKKYVFYDGPPFANGLPHYGHILASSLKDAVTRYWTMKGFYTPRVNGWDCHGLPVEYEIEKTLEISGHKEIEEFGVDKFNAACRESVFKYTKEWKEIITRIGRWVDFDNSYATLDNNFMESIWNVFSKIYDKGLVYKGFKSMHICPRCETPLSNFEVTQGYKDVTDFTVTAKFKLLNEDIFILAWTTTPWTLPGNQALALNENLEYIKFELKNWPDRPDGIYITSKDYYEKNFADIPAVKEEAEFPSSGIPEKINPKDLIGKKYKPLFPYYESESENFIITHADFVTTEDGTGVVHIAGGYGEDDYNLVKSLKLEPLSHVGLDGIFRPEVKDFAGKFVKGQDQNIAKYLEDKNLLFEGSNYKHSYPHCWRCNTPLLNYSLGAWFIEVTKIQDKLLKNNQKINWQPPHIKEGRFGRWLENVKDWNISRNRFWGAAIPIWECECGHTECIDSTLKLRQKSLDGNNLYFVRHGQAKHNVLDILSCDVRNKRELTEEGKKQAQTLAEKLKDKKITHIYCSPFHRAQMTAEIINQELQLEIITDERLKEKQVGDLDGQKFEVRTKELLESEDPYNHNIGNSGESYHNLEIRLMEFVDEITEKHTNDNVLIVTHGGLLAMVLKYYEAKEFDEELIKIAPYIDHDEPIHYYSGKIPTNEGKLDLHKPYIDEIKIKCDKCNKPMNRIPEVFDCWFESGSMPYAQLHYPFENKKDFEQNFPAEFIAEGLDQTRGWFYTLHVISTILFDEPAFKNVIVNGILLAKNGEKLSKSKKNYPDPTELFESKGVDSTRLFLYQSTAALAEDVRFSDDHVDEILKKFTLTLWNTYSFFITYANIDGFDPNEKVKVDVKKLHELDQWILSELNELIIEVTKQMDDYNLSKATRPLMDFVDNLSNWYIRRSRRRFWKSENDEDKMLAYHTLHTVLITLSKLIAPFTPFISDEIFRNLTKLTSVHLEDWPEADKGLINKDLNQKIHNLRKVVSLGHSIRGVKNIKVRQPLSKVQVAHADPKVLTQLEGLKEVILEELNVKELVTLDNPEDYVTETLKPNAKELGAELGPKMKDVLNAAREGQYEIKGDKVLIAGEELDIKNFERHFDAKEGFSAESDEGFVVILETEITEELTQEGWVRDIVRFVQEFRKETNYDVSDRIYLYLKTDDKKLEQAITNLADYIKRETLAIELQQDDEFKWDAEKQVDIEENQLTIALKKADV